MQYKRFEHGCYKYIFAQAIVPRLIKSILLSVLADTLEIKTNTMQ